MHLHIPHVVYLVGKKPKKKINLSEASNAHCKTKQKLLFSGLHTDIILSTVVVDGSRYIIQKYGIIVQSQRLKKVHVTRSKIYINVH